MGERDMGKEGQKKRNRKGEINRSDNIEET
jgi:hypothetical protein